LLPNIFNFSIEGLYGYLLLSSPSSILKNFDYKTDSPGFFEHPGYRHQIAEMQQTNRGGDGFSV
jgi:hypothetical protein